MSSTNKKKTVKLEWQLRLLQIHLEWQRGLDEDWDGWHYNTSNFSSGPYPTIKDALIDAAETIQLELDTEAKNKVI
jgi:hypothetical protein